MYGHSHCRRQNLEDIGKRVYLKGTAQAGCRNSSVVRPNSSGVPEKGHIRVPAEFSNGTVRKAWAVLFPGGIDELMAEAIQVCWLAHLIAVEFTLNGSAVRVTGTVARRVELIVNPAHHVRACRAFGGDGAVAPFD